MILFDLKCENGHQFEAWFPSSSKYDDQIKRNLVTCPYCNTNKVKKSLMAPNINLGKNSNKSKKDFEKVFAKNNVEKQIKKIKKLIEKNTDNVGDKFAEEARKIYYGEKKVRPIRGQTSKSEAKELIEEGIPFSSLPWTSKEDA